MICSRRRQSPASARARIPKSRSLPDHTLIDPQRVVQQTPLQDVCRSKCLGSLEEGFLKLTNLPPSPRSKSLIASAKLKRTEELELATDDQPAPKRLCPQHPTSPTDTASNPALYGAEISWQEYFGTWPPENVITEPTMIPIRSNEWPHSPSNPLSYNQSVRDGTSPVAWTNQYEERMKQAGMIMNRHQTQANISADSRAVCNVILEAKYDLPDGPAFREGIPVKVISSISARNEARIFRDITPYVVPSAELLHLYGCRGLDTINEALNAQWTKCNTIYGPQPKPDMVSGISTSAFTNEEREKLLMHHSSTSPNMFLEGMIYPFLICEVKSSNKSMVEAERQSMHSASIATRAIIELYRKIPVLKEVNQEVLVFSVAHDSTTIRICGHFALIEDDKTTFFRHQLYFGDIADDLGPDLQAKPYKIIRGIYEHFFPKHLARIRAGLARLRSQPAESSASGLETQNSAAGASSFQRQLKRRSLPASSMFEQEIERLRSEVGDLVRAIQSQMEESREREQRMEQQLAQERENSRQQMERSRQENERTEQQLAQEREYSRQQKEMMEKQLAQQEKIIQLLENAKEKET